MIALVKYTREKSLVWVIICDQHNGLFNPPVVKDFPFNLIHFLTSRRGPYLKVVVTGSADNSDDYPAKMKGWYHFDISSHCFDREEFKVWCEHYLLEDNTEVNPESDEARDALFWTGGVPHELDLLWKQPVEGLIEKTSLYRRQRFEEMTQSHGKFYDTLVDRKRDNLAQCVSRMALGLSPPNSRLGMDQQLFHIIKEDNAGHEMIAARNPVAREALLLFHGKHVVV